MSPASKRLLSSSRSPAHPSKKFHAGNVSPEEGEVEDPSAALPGPSQVPMLVERDGPRSDSFSRMALPFKPKGLPSGGSGMSMLPTVVCVCGPYLACHRSSHTARLSSTGLNAAASSVAPATTTRQRARQE
ncbi:hypothetical protein BOTBODRAFT_475378 [Botryobasidium botryosum FD-172 SS1]|uniref:Uncharacterized protein n=1 Tax=Botryobasidium botryosum (strain FD-172 SS1) TaxID=930990 RepID=A0A067N3S4_BOTB1|nr:hypothetical protein BOTBODRAFT_475378 [Botryobasidium botryosum FD-172 SS1]